MQIEEQIIPVEIPPIADIPAEQAAAAVGVDPGVTGDPLITERFAVASTFTPASTDEGARTVDCTWYTGAKVPRRDWQTGDEYDLILDPKGCRLDRLNNGAPVLDSHSAYGVENQKGVVRKAWIAGNKCMATLQFSKREDVTPIWNDVNAGIIQNLSPGMWIYSRKETTPDKQLRKEFTATDWEPFEISLVPVPADAQTTFMSAVTEQANPNVVKPEVAAAIITKEQQIMPEDVIPAAAPTAIELAAIRDGAVQAERTRASDIRSACVAAHVDENFAAVLVGEGVDIHVARERILAKLASAYVATAPFPPGPVVSMGADSRDKLREGLEAAVMFRHQPRNAAYQAAGREYAGLTLVDMARECLTAAGVKTRGMSRDEVARVALQGRNGAAQYFDASGMTTSDFPAILANVANKSLRKAYEAAPKTFMPFCTQTTAADFKLITRAQLSDVPTLSPINEAGEFHRSALSDNKETYKIKTFGEIVSISRAVIINDDLGALTRVPAGLGQAAANLESDTVWAVITANAAMSDTVALFHATHKNLSATNGLAAVANITTARSLLRKQTGPKGTILNLIPKFLLVPTALEGIAVQLTNPINLAATASSSDVPEFVRSMIPIVEPRLDAVASVGATNGTRRPIRRRSPRLNTATWKASRACTWKPSRASRLTAWKSKRAWNSA